jgi:hypothetical protein
VVTVLADSMGMARRRITLRFAAAGAYRMRVSLPRARLRGWSLPLPLEQTASATRMTVAYVAPPDTGWVLALDLTGTEPLALRASAIRFETTPAADSVLRALPPWTDAHAVAENARSLVVGR